MSQVQDEAGPGVARLKLARAQTWKLWGIVKGGRDTYRGPLFTGCN